MSENVTKEGIVVEKGQIWCALDKRGADRYAKVEAVREAKAVMYRCTAEGRIVDSVHEIKIAIARMHRHSTGWGLVQGANGKTTTAAPITATIAHCPAQFSAEE